MELRPPKLEAEQMHDKLSSAAHHLFAKRSLDEVSIEQLAVTAGLDMSVVEGLNVRLADLYIQVARWHGRDLMWRTTPVPGKPLGPLVMDSLEAFLSFVEQNPALYKAMTARRAERHLALSDVVDEVEQRFIARILDNLGVSAPCPQLLVEIRGWLGFLQRTTEEWLEQPQMGRDELLSIQVRHLMTVVHYPASTPALYRG